MVSDPEYAAKAVATFKQTGFAFARNPIPNELRDTLMQDAIQAIFDSYGKMVKDPESVADLLNNNTKCPYRPNLQSSLLRGMLFDTEKCPAWTRKHGECPMNEDPFDAIRMRIYEDDEFF
eukprot:gene20136-7198_t